MHTLILIHISIIVIITSSLSASSSSSSIQQFVFFFFFTILHNIVKIIDIMIVIIIIIIIIIIIATVNVIAIVILIPTQLHQPNSNNPITDDRVELPFSECVEFGFTEQLLSSLSRNLEIIFWIPDYKIVHHHRYTIESANNSKNMKPSSTFQLRIELQCQKVFKRESTARHTPRYTGRL